jgi:putative PIN family toxin of toxin-antitoxin system
MKVVLDTSVLISGLAYPNSIPGRIVAAWDLHTLGLAMSRFQLDEVARVLGYPKIRKLLGWSDARIESFVRQLLLRVELVEICGTAATVPDEPNDARPSWRPNRLVREMSLSAVTATCCEAPQGSAGRAAL